MQRVLPFISLMIWVTLLQASDSENPRYTTSAECQSCHHAQYQDWSNSHHSWAWREPSTTNVLGDFNNAEFEHAGFTYRFITEDNEYFVIADNASGESTRYKVHSVVGVTPLQQYLVQTEKGSLQALDVSWDTVDKRWYHLYPDIDTSAGNGLHWSGAYKNWNSRCAECHATDYRKNYDARQHRYASQQAEIGVGCEACHGPGQAHVAWARQKEDFDESVWLGIDKYGLLSTYTAGKVDSEINLCAGCHSRREPLGADSPPEGAEFGDHYKLSLLREELYFPDGQIKDEVYVYGSFIQSKMFARGVGCSDCHDSHSYQLKLKGNAICTQCHNLQGNPRFATLEKKKYDDPSHHFHKANSEGASCTDCHMPERNYMVVDGRRDHGFRIPRPGLSEIIGAPDVCTGCHQDKSLSWAAGIIKKQFPESSKDESNFAEIFTSIGAIAIEESMGALMTLARDTSLPAIVRATALERLANLPHSLTDQDIKIFTRDQNALVRMTSIGLLRTAENANKVPLLIPLLEDPSRSVRIEAAKSMIAIPPQDVPDNRHQSLQQAMKEFQGSMLAKADFPEGQLVLGGVALTLKKFNAASQAFERAVDMDPQLVDAWIILIRIKAALGRTAEARNLMLKAIQNNPESHDISQFAASMGLSIGRKN